MRNRKCIPETQTIDVKVQFGQFMAIGHTRLKVLQFKTDTTRGKEDYGKGKNKKVERFHKLFISLKVIYPLSKRQVVMINRVDCGDNRVNPFLRYQWFFTQSLEESTEKSITSLRTLLTPREM